MAKNNIIITVKPTYLGERQEATEEKFLFSYLITIYNGGDCVVKLLRRKWQIFDGITDLKVVTGDGVIGLTPEIYPNENFTYESYCTLKNHMGSMGGYYIMLNMQTNKKFRVEIPKFSLEHPCILN